MELAVRVVDDSVIKHIPIGEQGAQHETQVYDAPLMAMVRRLAYMRDKNERSRGYFESDVSTIDLGVAVNAKFKDVPNYLGLVRTGIESLAEKVTLAAVDILPRTALDASEDAIRTEQATRASRLLREALDDSDAKSVFAAAITDSLIYGVGFISPSPGDEDEGEPPLILTAESPSRVTHTYSTRKSRVTDFIRLVDVVTRDGRVIRLDFVYVNDLYEMTFSTNGWCLDKSGAVTMYGEPQLHGMPVCPLIALVNRPDTSKAGHGRSEITPSVRSAVMKSMRTHLNMEVAREYYAHPLRYYLNLPANTASMPAYDYDAPSSQAAFNDTGDGQQILLPKSYRHQSHSPVSADMSKVFYSEVTPGVENQTPVQVGQLVGSSPAVLVAQIREYTMQIASEMALPADFVGIETSNPSSAEAMKTATKRLVDRAKNRAESHTPAFSQFGIMCLSIISGADYTSLRKTFRARPRFANPNPIADSAAADGVSKLISSGALQPDSLIVAETLNLTPEQTAIWLEEQRLAQTRAFAQTLATARQVPASVTVTDGATTDVLDTFEG